MWTKSFWKQALERAIKTAAQAAGVILGAEQVGVLRVDWVTVGSLSAAAAILSLLTSIATSGVGEPNDPSAVTRPRVSQ